MDFLFSCFRGVELLIPRWCLKHHDVPIEGSICCQNGNVGTPDQEWQENSHAQIKFTTSAGGSVLQLHVLFHTSARSRRTACSDKPIRPNLTVLWFVGQQFDGDIKGDARVTCEPSRGIVMRSLVRALPQKQNGEFPNLKKGMFPFHQKRPTILRLNPEHTLHAACEFSADTNIFAKQKLLHGRSRCQRGNISEWKITRVSDRVPFRENFQDFKNVREDGSAWMYRESGPISVGHTGLVHHRR